MNSLKLFALGMVVCLWASSSPALGSGSFLFTGVAGTSTVDYSFGGSFNVNSFGGVQPTQLFFSDVNFPALSGALSAAFNTSVGASGLLSINGDPGTPLTSLEFFSGGGAPDDIILNFSPGGTLISGVNSVTFNGGGTLDISPFVVGTDLLEGSGVFTGAIGLNFISVPNTNDYVWQNIVTVPEPSSIALVVSTLSLLALRKLRS